MRWDDLFADLEAQLEAGITHRDQELDLEEERLRIARLRLRDRIAGAARAGPVTIDTAGAGVMRIRVATIGADWIAGELVERADGASAVVPLGAVRDVLLDAGAQQEASLQPPQSGLLTDRLGVGTLLRDLARRRRAVEVRTVDGAAYTGTLDRAGRDHADLAEHPLDLPRRASAVRRIRVLPFDRIAVVLLR